MNITVPTPIQRLAIQPVLDGRDVIAKAETGTGKTLAFGAPMISKIDPARASVLGLVLCPTRELAQQDAKVLEILGAARGVRVALIVGGDPMGPQVDALKAGAQVVVGTPGRVLDLYKQRFLSFPWTEFAILDEADVMLEIGFIDDVKMILSYTPDERQTLLFSATFPPELLKLAREYTKNPVEIATAAGISTVDAIEQGWMRVDDDDRALALIRLIEQSAKDDVLLVFCDRRTEVDKLMRRLERLPYSIKALHGGYDQAARFRVMSAFRTGEVKTLVATDVASRGLDVTCVTHVVNFGSPHDLTDYTHRIGRTGRAGRSGRAITLVGPSDMRRWNPILREASWAIPEVEPPRSSHASRSDGGARGGRGRPDCARPERHERSASPDSPKTIGRNERDDPRVWPVDGAAPRSAEEAPSRSHRPPRPHPSSRQHQQDPLDHPAAQPDLPASTPPRDSRWPTDEHAHEEGSRPRDLRPNRESPPRTPRSAPREASSARREDRPKPSAPRSPRNDARSPRSDEPRPTGGRERSEERLNDRHAPAAPSRDAGEPHAQTRPLERSGERSGERPVERPGQRRPQRPGPDARAPRSTSDRANDRPPRDEARRPERAAAPRPERNAASRERPEPVEERPPGTFERPMHGGLLGHAAHRPVPQKPNEERGESRRGGHGGRGGGRSRGPRREPGS
jgi:superfamily II DNA/RNA helicase